MTRLYAHRGVSAEFPENTIPAFARALESEVFGIELDVHLAADGVPVVIHDETVDRTTDGSGSVAAMTTPELKALDAGDGATIPTLAEVLDLVGDRLHFDIEVKAAAAANAVLAETARRSALRFAMSSFNHDVLRQVRAIDSVVELWPLGLGAIDDLVETALALGSPCVAIHDPLVNDEIIGFLRGLGLGCWVWTVNDPARAEALAAGGAVGICTDDPATILARLEGDASRLELP